MTVEGIEPAYSQHSLYHTSIGLMYFTSSRRNQIAEKVPGLDEELVLLLQGFGDT